MEEEKIIQNNENNAFSSDLINNQNNENNIISNDELLNDILEIEQQEEKPIFGIKEEAEQREFIQITEGEPIEYEQEAEKPQFNNYTNSTTEKEINNNPQNTNDTDNLINTFLDGAILTLLTDSVLSRLIYLPLKMFKIDCNLSDFQLTPHEKSELQRIYDKIIPTLKINIKPSQLLLIYLLVIYGMRIADVISINNENKKKFKISNPDLEANINADLIPKKQTRVNKMVKKGRPKGSKNLKKD